jgi:hypothetical protein
VDANCVIKSIGFARRLILGGDPRLVSPGSDCAALVALIEQPDERCLTGHHALRAPFDENM